MKEGTQVETHGKMKGVVKFTDGDFALVWFYGHQRNSAWYSVDDLKPVKK